MSKIKGSITHREEEGDAIKTIEGLRAQLEKFVQREPELRAEISNITSELNVTSAGLEAAHQELELRRKEVSDLLQDNVKLREGLQAQALRSAANAGKVEALSQVIVEALRNGR